MSVVYKVNWQVLFRDQMGFTSCLFHLQVEETKHIAQKMWNKPGVSHAGRRVQCLVAASFHHRLYALTFALQSEHEWALLASLLLCVCTRSYCWSLIAMRGVTQIKAKSEMICLKFRPRKTPRMSAIRKPDWIPWPNSGTPADLRLKEHPGAHGQLSTSFSPTLDYVFSAGVEFQH